jgi:phage-related protein
MRRPLYWVGSSLKDLREFPERVKSDIGYALDTAQFGGKAPQAKPLKGFGGAGVLEIVEDYDRETFRAVYVVRLESGVYVLHAFQKKAHRGRKTDPKDLEVIRERLAAAEEQDAEIKKKERSGT